MRTGDVEPSACLAGTGTGLKLQHCKRKVEKAVLPESSGSITLLSSPPESLIWAKDMHLKTFRIAEAELAPRSIL